MPNYHYLDDQWVDDDNLKISVFDLSVLRGFGTFDYLRTYNFKPFRLEDHLQRFERSAGILGIKLPLSQNQMRETIAEGIKRNNQPNVGIRMVATGGVGIDSVTQGEPSLIMIFQEVGKPADKYYAEGAEIITYTTPRQVSNAKSLAYMTAILAMQQAAERDCIEAIYVDPPLGDSSKRRIYEGTRTNFFAIINNQLYTPREGMLSGITRQVVLELAAKLNIPTHEENLYLEDVADGFNEAFITSSDKEIVPVIKIDDITVGSGQPGPVTKQLMAAFDKAIADAS